MTEMNMMILSQQNKKGERQRDRGKIVTVELRWTVKPMSLLKMNSHHVPLRQIDTVV